MVMDRFYSLMLDPRLTNRPMLQELGEVERSAHGLDGESPPTPPSDETITTAHLVNSAIFNASHCQRHCSKLTQPEVQSDPEQLEHDSYHANHHVGIALEDLISLRDHLKETDPAFAEETAKLTELQKSKSWYLPPAA